MFFDFLELVFDPAAPPLHAAVNMAVDEVLLAGAEHPILRVYAWACPAVTFGYFEKWETVHFHYPSQQWELVRRWTGGGVVEHGADWTYSVIAPRRHPFAHSNAAESYRLLHECLVTVLREAQLQSNITLAPIAAEKESNACFENPARHDVLADGLKIAGAAQRRSRFGLLHQGSVQNVAVPDGLAQRLAAAMAGNFAQRSVTAAELAAAEALAATKYATEGWNRRF